MSDLKPKAATCDWLEETVRSGGQEGKGVPVSDMRILVADDETLMRRLLAQMLSLQPDFEVVGEASDGRQAVEESLKLRP